jgi:ubiquitin carboxyl-terminal hydrolase 7
MLIYVRRSEAPELLAPVPESVMPSHLKKRFEEDQKLREEKKKEAAEAHLYTTLKVAVEEDLKQHPVEKFDLVDFDNIKSHKILKKSSIREFKAKAEELWGIPQNKQRYWPVIRRRNKTLRPDKAYSAADEEKRKFTVPFTLFLFQTYSPTFLVFIALSILKPQQEYKMFLETSTVPDVGPDGQASVNFFPPLGSNDILLFLKYFDTTAKKLEFVGHKVLSSSIKPEDLLPLLRELKQLPTTCDIKMYEEIKPTMIEPLKSERTLYEGEITNGDIVVFELAHPENSAPEYYEYIQQRIVVHFRKLEQPKEDAFTLELLTKMDYDTLAKRVAEKLNWDPTKLRFTGHTP